MECHISSSQAPRVSGRKSPSCKQNQIVLRNNQTVLLSPFPDSVVLDMAKRDPGPVFEDVVQMAHQLSIIRLEIRMRPQVCPRSRRRFVRIDVLVELYGREQLLSRFERDRLWIVLETEVVDAVCLVGRQEV